MHNTAQIIKFERPVVKADIENGYDRLAHAITDAIIRNPAKLSGCEIQVLFAIIAKTYRFHKKSDWISNAQICEMTNLGKSHVSNLIKSLLAKKVIYKADKNTGINTTISDWEVHESVNCVHKSMSHKSSRINEQQFTNLCTPVHESVNKSSRINEQHNKETITKETITKEKGVGKSTQKNKIPFVQIPDFVNRELFDNYLSVRVAKKYNVSEEALKLLVSKINKIHNNGHDVNAAIENAILSEWKSIYEPNVPAQKNRQFGQKLKPENFTQKDYGQSTFSLDHLENCHD